MFEERDKNLKKMEAGFDEVTEDETWSLDFTIAWFIIPRLEKFKEVTIAYPAELNSMEEWYDIIDKMIAAFKIIHSNYAGEDEDAILEEGLTLFKEYLPALWW